MDNFDNQITSFSRCLKRLLLPVLMDPFHSFQRSPIKGAFYIHFILFTSSMVTLNWLPQICYLYNLLFLLCLLWAIESNNNPEPLQFAAIINLLSIIFDIIAMSVSLNYNHYRNGMGFSIFLCVCNILIRPFTTFILLQHHSDRDIRQTLYGNNNNENITTGSGIHNPQYEQYFNRNGYQNLDNQNQQQQQQQQKLPQQIPSSSSSSNTNNPMPYQSIPEPIIDIESGSNNK